MKWHDIYFNVIDRLASLKAPPYKGGSMGAISGSGGFNFEKDTMLKTKNNITVLTQTLRQP
jgi:hypothetical protein